MSGQTAGQALPYLRPTRGRSDRSPTDVTDAVALVREIHRSGTGLVLAIAGGGTEAIGALLRHGGGSATLLEASVPYHPRAFDRYVGGPPDQYCSAPAARALAMAA